MEISATSVGAVLGEDVVRPVTDELGHIYDTRVEVSILGGEPPAAGMSEIALTIAASGITTALVVEFFKPLVSHAGQQFRDKILTAIRNGKQSKASGRRYAPVLIELGTGDRPNPVRYFFHGDIDAGELLHRLQAADEHVRTLPPELFSGPAGPPENAFYWDVEEDRWRGGVFRYPDEPYGEYWMPRDLFDY